jgi:hypothetical protein
MAAAARGQVPYLGERLGATMVVGVFSVAALLLGADARLPRAGVHEG